MVCLAFRQHCRFCAVLAKKRKGKKIQVGGFFTSLRIPLMQSATSGCSCLLPSPVRLCSTDTVAVGAVRVGWILPRKHSSSMENIAQISSSCYGVSVHFLRKIKLRYSSCTDQSKYFFLKSVSLSVFCKCQILQNKSMLMKATPLCTQQLETHIILDFIQFILLSHITIPKHFQEVSIFHEQDKEK